MSDWRIVEAFDKDETAGAFLREDGEGGFASGVYRMAREIDRLRAAAREAHAVADQYNSTMDDRNAEITALRADRDRLREALEPFADWGENWDDARPSEHRVDCRNLASDLRRARAAIAQSKETGK